MKAIVLFTISMMPMMIDADPARPIELLHNADIKDAEILDRKVDNLLAKIRQCAAAGLANPAECHCQYPQKLEAARETYQSVLQKHPEWEGRAVIWWDTQRSYSSNIHFGGLKHQIERPCHVGA